MNRLILGRGVIQRAMVIHIWSTNGPTLRSTQISYMHLKPLDRITSSQLGNLL